MDKCCLLKGGGYSNKITCHLCFSAIHFQWSTVVCLQHKDLQESVMTVSCQRPPGWNQFHFGIDVIHVVFSMAKRKETFCWPAKITFIAVTELGFRLTCQTENEWALIRDQTAGWIVRKQNKDTHKGDGESRKKLPSVFNNKLAESRVRDQAFILQLIWCWPG